MSTPLSRLTDAFLYAQDENVVESARFIPNHVTLSIVLAAALDLAGLTLVAKE